MEALDPPVERVSLEPFGERGGPVDVGNPRDAAGLRVGVEEVDEARLDARAHVQERERVDGWGEPGGEAGCILVRLQFNAGQGVSGGLSLQDADGLALNKQAISGFPNEQTALRGLCHSGFGISHRVRNWLGMCAGMSRSPTVK